MPAEHMVRVSIHIAGMLMIKWRYRTCHDPSMPWQIQNIRRGCYNIGFRVGAV